MVGILKGQATKLLALSDCLATWNSSAYGTILKWCDEGSLSLSRTVWHVFTRPDPGLGDDATRYDELAKQFREYHTTTGFISDGTHIPMEALSAAPLALTSIKEGSEDYKHYWDSVTLAQPSTSPNPLYGVLFSTRSSATRAGNPLVGFHLATAFAHLAPTSPLKPCQDDGDTPKIVQAVKIQFREWCTAFRELMTNQITIRFVIACPLAFCQTLQHILITQDTPPKHFRRQFDTSYYELDPQSYGRDGTSPHQFDVIDTLNSADGPGALDVLVSSSPLLKDVASSTLYMEIPRPPNKTYRDVLDSLLFSHAPSISLLVGLVPIEYWANMTSASYVDEFMLTTSDASTYDENIRTYGQLSWKIAGYFPGQTRGVSLLNLDAIELAKLLFLIYTRMLGRPNDSEPAPSPEVKHGNEVHGITGSGYAYRTENYVAFIRRLLHTVKVDREKACDTLLSLIQNDVSSTTSREYHEELRHELQAQGMSGSSAGKSQVEDGTSKSITILLKVPRESVDKLSEIAGSNDEPLSTEVIMSSKKGPSDILRTRFTNLRLTFGDATSSGDYESDNFSVSIIQDYAMQKQNSSLIVYFNAPLTLLQSGLDTINIAIILRRMPKDIQHSEHTIYKTSMGNRHDVLITKRVTNSDGFTVTYSRSSAAVPVTEVTNDSRARTAWSVNLDPETGRVSKMTSLVRIIAEDGKLPPAELRSMCLKQTSPCNFEVGFSPEDDIVYPASFPLPVLKDSVEGHVDEESGSGSAILTLSAPVASPLDLEMFSELMYPIVLGQDFVPVTLDSGHVNLDALPILSVDEADRPANQWLTTLTSHQFSVRERRSREEYESFLSSLNLTDAGTPPVLATPSLPPPPPPLSPRLSFKESLFTIFMVSSGLQGGSTGLFALTSRDDPARGNQLLLFVRAIRLGPASGRGGGSAVAADAAALPLTRELVDSRALEPFLLVLRELEICALDVDGDAELALWRRALPVFAERCRDWAHDPQTCEYRRPGGTGTPPLLSSSSSSYHHRHPNPNPDKQAAEENHRFMCTCGNGKLPPDFVRLPEWEAVAARYAVRVALAPAFAAPFVEDVVDVDLLRAQGGLAGLLRERCRGCGATESKKEGGGDGGGGGDKLLHCMRCRAVAYCGRECQRRDWKKHRMECKAADE